MRKTVAVLAVAGAIGMIGAVPASAGQSSVVAGGIYKGVFVSSIGMEYKSRVKVYDSGKNLNFSLKCAGIQREKFQVKKGKSQIRSGADEIQVKGRLAFKKNDSIKGEITKIVTPGSTCSAPGDFILFLQGD